MFTNTLKSAGIAGVVAFVVYIIFALLLGGATFNSALLPALSCGVGTFIVALIITTLISSYYKNRRRQ